MGILNRKMNPIDRAQHYIEQLKDLKNKLAYVSEKLNTIKESKNIDFDEYERLFEKEFELSMALYSLHEDIHRILDYAKTQDNEFMVKRLKKETDKIFKPIVINIA